MVADLTEAPMLPPFVKAHNHHAHRKMEASRQMNHL